MSLQIWLPLNGNLNNYGLSGVSANGSPTVNGSGKIGQCYTCNSSNYFYVSNSITAYDYSFSFWMKVPSSMASVGAWNVMFSFYAKNINNDETINWCPIEWASYNNIKIYDDANHQNIWMAPGSQFEYDKWCHYTITHTGTNSGCTIKVYTDGILRGTYNNEHRMVLSPGNIVFGNGINPSYGPLYFNDFRLYDSCLSYSEVKEISQALVVHYPFNQVSLRVPNLIDHMEAGGRTAVTSSYAISADFSQNVDTYVWFNCSPALEYNKTYTLSFDVENFPLGASWGWSLWNSDNYVFNVNGNGHYSYTFTPTTNRVPSDSSLSRFLFDDKGREGAANTVYFKNFKIELGEEATSFCTNSESTKINDCSGFRNNGYLSIGKLALSNDSVRNSSSLLFSNLKIDSPFSTYGLSNLTYAVWVKPFARTSDRSCISIGGTYITIDNEGYLAGYAYGKSNEGYHTGSTVIPLNQWTHIAIVWDDSYIYGYVNGTLDFKVACTGTFSGSTQQLGIEGSDSRTYSGLMSDFRIYATALSADDVAHLYKNFGSVDKNRSLLCSEVKENSENIFKSEYISKYASSLDGSYGQWGTRNSVPCMLIQPHKFYYGSGDERNKSVLKDYFIPNTQYIFDMWMDADDVVYNGNNVACGFEIWYTDDTSDSTFVIAGNQSNPIGFQHKTLVTAAGKSIKGLGIYYYTSITVYYKVGSFIAPVSQASLGTNGVFNTAQIVEVDGTASINKGGSSYVNSIIEI